MGNGYWGTFKVGFWGKFGCLAKGVLMCVNDWGLGRFGLRGFKCYDGVKEVLVFGVGFRLLGFIFKKMWGLGGGQNWG